MPAQLAPIVAPIAAVGVLLALVFTALATWLLEWGQGQVRGLPIVGGTLAGALAGVEGGLLTLSRSITTGAIAWLGWAVVLYVAAFQQLVRAVAGVETAVVSGIQAQLGNLIGVVSLAVLPPIEREIPAWFQELEKAASQLPNEPAFRAGGPVALLLRWLSIAWSVASRLGPFIRLVALPIGAALLALWGLIELLGRLTRLETIQAGLIGFVNNLDRFRQADEAAFGQLVVVVNSLLRQTAQLQVDLERERAARVALATQTQQALDASQRLQDARYGQLGSKLNPLLALTVLGLLSGSAIDVLRKTAQCDPCAQLDQLQPDFEERISALETFGE